METRETASTETEQFRTFLAIVGRSWRLRGHTRSALPVSASTTMSWTCKQRGPRTTDTRCAHAAGEKAYVRGNVALSNPRNWTGVEPLAVMVGVVDC